MSSQANGDHYRFLCDRCPMRYVGFIGHGRRCICGGDLKNIGQVKPYQLDRGALLA